MEQSNTIVNADKKIILYHGSKSGIKGAISPVSRDKCDFGKGFYMGTDKMQPLTLVCNFPDPRLYTLEVDLTGLKILDVSIGIDWALLIAYNRGKMESARGTAVYERIFEMAHSCDIMISHIADDRMFVVLDRFFNGEITDTALIHSLSALKLGKQYAAITEKACRNIKIIDEQTISDNERQTLKLESERNRLSGISLAEDICRRYRREGHYFDEILKAGDGNASA